MNGIRILRAEAGGVNGAVYMSQDLSSDPRVAEMLEAFCKFVYLAADIGSPTSKEKAGGDVFLNRAEAAEKALVSVATFDRARREGLIKPAMTIKRSPKFAESDVLNLRAQLGSK